MSDPTPFGPLSPILPVPVDAAETGETGERYRWHDLRSHYVFGGFSEDATLEQEAALAEWCRARFEAAVAACPECRGMVRDEAVPGD